MQVDRRFKWLLLITLFASANLFSQQSYTPLHHQVYPLLEKGEALGIYDSYYLRILPLTRSEIRGLLLALTEKSQLLTNADRLFLDQLLPEFTDPEVGKENEKDGEIHLFRYSEGSSQVFVDLRGIQEGRGFRSGKAQDPDERIAETTVEGSVRAHFGDHFSVGLIARNSMILGQEDRESRFDPSKGPIQVPVGGSVFSDQVEGYVGFHYKPLKLFLGRMRSGWGSGLNGQLGLSSMNEPADQIRFSLDFEKFRFSFLHSKLVGFNQKRYLAGHRLDVLLFDRIQMGIYETIVYGGRDVESAYLNPFLVYHVMEHHLGDLDNNTLGYDVAIRLAEGLKLSAEVFIDDLSINRSLGTYWGNKLAYMAGIHWIPPHPIRNIEFVATYTRIDPFVYTHHDSVNIYTHYGESIGSRLGPNAERYLARILFRPYRDLFMTMSANYDRKGKGDIFTAHTFADGEYKGFLRGVLETRMQFHGKLNYQFSRDMFVGLEGSTALIKNAELRKGISRREIFVRLYLEINY